MTRFSPLSSLAFALLGLAACGRAPAPPPSSTANAVAPHENLNRIVERYWDERAPVGVSIAPQFLADSLSLERRFLAEVLALPRAPLDADAALTYDIFKRQRELAIEGFTYPSELLPVNPFDSMPLEFARAAARFGRQPRKTDEEAARWQLRIDDYVRWTEQALATLPEGMRRGYTLPRVLVERTLPLLQGLGEDTSTNVFYVPLQAMPQTIDPSERIRLTASLTRAIKDKLLPAYRELH